MERINRLEDLKGTEISGVAFICDYVEFYFGGPFPILRSISNPIIEGKGFVHSFPSPGSRDELCRVIGSKVLTVDLKENSALELTISNGCKVRIPLDPASFRGGEAMHFVPVYNGPIQVW